jgi:hypothetical protein
MKIITRSNFQALGFALIATGILSRYAVSSGTLPNWIISSADSLGIGSRGLELFFMLQTLAGAAMLLIASALGYLSRNKGPTR